RKDAVRIDEVIPDRRIDGTCRHDGVASLIHLDESTSHVRLRIVHAGHAARMVSHLRCRVRVGAILKRRQHVPVREPAVRMRMTESRHVTERCYYPRLERIVQIEQPRASRSKVVREQMAVGAELLLRMM